MAIDRYEFNSIHTKKLKGKCYNTTILPLIKRSFEDRYIISIEGDRLDSLSYEFYGDARHWTIIANANNLGKGSLIVPAGKQIRIPDESVITTFREIVEKAEKDR